MSNCLSYFWANRFKEDTLVVISNKLLVWSYGTQRMECGEVTVAGPYCMPKVLFANDLLLLLTFISISYFWFFHLGLKEKVVLNLQSMAKFTFILSQLPTCNLSQDRTNFCCLLGQFKPSRSIVFASWSGGDLELLVPRMAREVLHLYPHPCPEWASHL